MGGASEDKKVTGRTLPNWLTAAVLSAGGCAVSQRDEVRIGDYYARELEVRLMQGNARVVPIVGSRR